MLLSFHLLVVAGFLMFINIRTTRNRAAKKITYYGMWGAMIYSVILAFQNQL